MNTHLDKHRYWHRNWWWSIVGDIAQNNPTPFRSHNSGTHLQSHSHKFDIEGNKKCKFHCCWRFGEWHSWRDIGHCQTPFQWHTSGNWRQRGQNKWDNWNCNLQKKKKKDVWGIWIEKSCLNELRQTGTRGSIKIFCCRTGGIADVGLQSTKMFKERAEVRDWKPKEKW